MNSTNSEILPADAKMLTSSLPLDASIDKELENHLKKNNKHLLLDETTYNLSYDKQIPHIIMVESKDHGGDNLSVSFQKIKSDLYDTILEERNRYKKIYDIIESYVKEKNLLISNLYKITGLNDLIDELYDFQYTIYCERPLEHSTEITNRIYEGYKNDKMVKFLNLKTVIKNEEFIVEYDGRIMAKIFALQKYKRGDKVRILKAIEPFIINEIPYMPPEVEIIDIYQKMYNGSLQYRQFEIILFEETRRRYRELGIYGSGSKKGSRKLNNKVNIDKKQISTKHGDHKIDITHDTEIKVPLNPEDDTEIEANNSENEIYNSEDALEDEVNNLDDSLEVDADNLDDTVDYIEYHGKLSENYKEPDDNESNNKEPDYNESNNEEPEDNEESDSRHTHNYKKHIHQVKGGVHKLKYHSFAGEKANITSEDINEQIYKQEKSKSCYDKKKDVLEALKVAIIKDFLKDRKDIMLIGPMAYSWYAHGKDFCPMYDRLQVISSIRPSKLRQEINNYLASIGQRYVLSLGDDLELMIPKDFRTKRQIFSINIVSERGIKTKPFLEYFNTAQFDIVPTMIKDGVLLGQKDVLLRFLFIDLWVAKFVYLAGKIEEEIYIKRISRLWDVITHIHIIPNHVDGFLGIYQDYDVAKKKLNTGTSVIFAPYYPFKNMELYGHLRTFDNNKISHKNTSDSENNSDDNATDNENISNNENNSDDNASENDNMSDGDNESISESKSDTGSNVTTDDDTTADSNTTNKK